ncbi:MAG TPA: tRNA (adenosine(37)-N6)-threonylcarbamoyltransferase complex ATPase subunit type 1 TsaE [Acidimicrobiales bacterium]|nr:tRNA (adenosine(37)-N6)-threonylcarbamoyltransferase complex ATPase subunit type 1 TsaE [Acidimicrobiales bacterium]
MSRVVGCATASAGATRELAGVVAGLCAPGDVILLSGDLGAGKTTFAQGFAHSLGIDEPVTSPTFTLLRSYEVIGVPSGIRTLLHADLYRLDHHSEIADLGLGELVEDGGVALVEWGDAVEGVLGAGALTVSLAPVADEDDHRSVTVAAADDGWRDRWPALERALSRWRVHG